MLDWEERRVVPVIALALSSANASQKALWVTKLSLLKHPRKILHHTQEYQKSGKTCEQVFSLSLSLAALSLC